MDDKVAGALIRPTDVSETQKVEGLRSSFPMLLPLLGGVPPELNQARLLWMEFQAEVGQPFPQLLKNSSASSRY
jgi:hypothetical protein